MSEIPGDLKFLKSHEWARVEGDGKVTVGISDHAQGMLGDLVYVELPTSATRRSGQRLRRGRVGEGGVRRLQPGDRQGRRVNAALSDKPETINEDAYGEGWIFVIEPRTPSSSTSC
jgi:glycine cleavage system H protein